MKNTLENLINNDTSYNRNVTRYLHKTNPDLWNQILEATSFLPDDAKPKQRVWHILNDVYDRPTCPITGEYVKWWENRYLETINRSASTTRRNKQGLNNTQTPEAKAKRTESLREGFRTGRIKPKQWTKEESASRYKKIRQATIDKYGVHSTLLIKTVREQQYQTKVDKGIITAREDRTARQLYYDEVVRLTRESWNQHFDKINPDRIIRGNDWHLDHMYSIQAGFRENIPPEIIAHWTNLCMIPGNENSSKGMSCSKTKEQLFEDAHL